MAGDPNFQRYFGTFGYQWDNKHALLTFSGTSSLNPLPLRDHALGQANLALCIRETCYLVDASPGTEGWEWPLSYPVTICWYEDINSIVESPLGNRSWRQIQQAINAVTSLPAIAAAYFMLLILAKILDFVNGWPATSAIFSIDVSLNLLTDDYFTIVAGRLPSLNLSSEEAIVEAITRSLTMNESNGNGGEMICTICLNVIRDGEIAEWMPCMHCCHRNCIIGWLTERSNCPICLYELWRR